MTASRQLLEDRLRDAGARPVPAPSPQFVAALEARLLGASTGHPSGRVVALSAPPRRRVRPAAAVLGVAASVAAAVLVAALAGWFGQTSSAHDLALASAADTTVVLPDGTTVQGRDGLALPDGSIVRTGAGGHAAAGPVELGPGLQAVVDGGQLRLSTAASLPSLPAVTLPKAPPVTVPKPSVSLPPKAAPQAQGPRGLLGG